MITDHAMQAPPSKRRNSLKQRVRWHISNATSRLLERPAAAPYPMVKLKYWTPEDGEKVNFGDELSRTVVSLMLARKGATLQDSSSSPRELLAIGSVLHLANTDATIWGTGVHGAIARTEHRYTRLDVRACRGPITKSFLDSKGVRTPEIFGDPGLLISRLTGNRFAVDPKYDFGFVPNLHDLRHVQEQKLEARYPNIKFIDPLRSWDVVVRDIVECAVVLASSLHGIVVAEAFGRPASYVRLTEREPTLKYEDYYLGTNRPLVVYDDLEKAMRTVPQGFEEEQLNALESAFPYDLWGIN